MFLFFFLSQTIFFALKLTLSDVIIPAPTFLCLVLAWYILFILLCLYVHRAAYSYWFFIFTQNHNLCFLFGHWYYVTVEVFTFPLRSPNSNLHPTQSQLESPVLFMIWATVGYVCIGGWGYGWEIVPFSPESSLNSKFKASGNKMVSLVSSDLSLLGPSIKFGGKTTIYIIKTQWPNAIRPKSRMGGRGCVPGWAGLWECPGSADGRGHAISQAGLLVSSINSFIFIMTFVLTSLSRCLLCC